MSVTRKEPRTVESIMLACHKGNKKRLNHFVKILTWWSHTADKVQTFVLDINTIMSTSDLVVIIPDEAQLKTDRENIRCRQL